jgi:predicted RNA polymerase sigma factor
MRAVRHYQEEGDTKKMMAVYSRYAELVDSAEVWQSLAEMYTQEERWQEAKVSAQRALELATDDKKRNSIEVFLDIVEKRLGE